jgi:hypothetical protein
MAVSKAVGEIDGEEVGDCLLHFEDTQQHELVKLEKKQLFHSLNLKHECETSYQSSNWASFNASTHALTHQLNNRLACIS